MTTATRDFGLGIGWRAEIAPLIDCHAGLGFVEIVAESVDPKHPGDALLRLMDRGVAIIPHGISLSLGGAEYPDPARLERLAKLAERFRSPFVSEHVAFVRAEGVEAGHLLPVPRDRETLDILVENVGVAQKSLPVPIALENITALFEWPSPAMTEGAFLRELLDRTRALLLLDVANVFAAAKNFGHDPLAFFRSLPLDRLAYVHVGGGEEHDGVYHDTHAHAVPAEVFALVEDLCAMTHVPGLMLERDDQFPEPEDIERELATLAAAVAAGNARRNGVPHVR